MELFRQRDLKAGLADDGHEGDPYKGYDDPEHHMQGVQPLEDGDIGDGCEGIVGEGLDQAVIPQDGQNEKYHAFDKPQGEQEEACRCPFPSASDLGEEQDKEGELIAFRQGIRGPAGD